MSIASPRSHGLPQMAGGSASALSLSRPAQASLTLRPAGSLSRPQATFVTRLQPARLPARAARQLPDQSTTLRWIPPPLTLCAVGAHCQSTTSLICGCEDLSRTFAWASWNKTTSTASTPATRSTTFLPQIRCGKISSAPCLAVIGIRGRLWCAASLLFPSSSSRAGRRRSSCTAMDRIVAPRICGQRLGHHRRVPRRSAGPATGPRTVRSDAGGRASRLCNK